MKPIDPEELRFLLNRRRFVAGSAALAAVPLMPWRALAKEAPHTFKQGEAEITVVSDGSLTLPLNIISLDASPEQLADIAKRMGWPADSAKPHANVPVIRIGSEIIVVDNGSGTKFQDTAGQLAENLATAGIDPSTVTKVVFTHAHPDHIWGTQKADGTLLFPSADYYVGEAEWNFWMDPDLLTKMPAAMEGMVKGAQRDLAAVKDKATMVKNGHEVAPGLKVIDTPGHTPGHISLELEGEEGLLITGDAVTNQLVSFEHPEWKFGFDAIHESAIQNRKALVDRAATDKVKLLGFHWIYPGVGYAEKDGNAYRYVPAS